MWRKYITGGWQLTARGPKNAYYIFFCFRLYERYGYSGKVR